MAEVENAGMTNMDEENFDFADDILIDTLSASKLAFLVPLVEKILLNLDSETKLKFAVLSMLKRSINETFIKVISFIKNSVFWFSQTK